MENNISKTYLDEALRIRKEYLKCIKIIEKKEAFKQYKNELDDIRNAIINTDIEKLENLLLEKAKLIDNKLLDIYYELSPIYETFNNLEYDADKLYDAIRQKYPKLKTEEIRNQLWSYIEKIII